MRRASAAAQGCPFDQKTLELTAELIMNRKMLGQAQQLKLLCQIAHLLPEKLVLWAPPLACAMFREKAASLAAVVDGEVAAASLLLYHSDDSRCASSSFVHHLFQLSFDPSSQISSHFSDQ